MFRSFLALILLFALAACTPGTKGSSASSAFDVREGPIMISDAGGYYASYQVVPQAFGLDPDDFATAVVKNPRKGKKTSANITNRFSVANTSMPEDWEVMLSSAKLIKEVAEVGSRSVSYYYWLDLTFKIDVPEGAEPGVYGESVRVKARSGVEQAVPINFILASS